MPVDVIAVFDIGKTNKKLLLFDSALNLVHQDEHKFAEIADEDGFSCDDIDKIESWMKECVSDILQHDLYNIKALNFTTYGASLMYVDASGRRLTPVYNYLKEMPEGVLEGFYESYGGVEEFCRKTASPALGMLNSGLQSLWLKRKRPAVFERVSSIMHFPQYLSFRFTNKVTSEFTSIGCHTAMWDFDNHCYHPWIGDEKILLPDPVSNSTVWDTHIGNRVVKTGIGIHDSSASLVPYFKGTKEDFILLSTGTWCILMNPFNTEPLTAEQLRRDSLCYMSINQQQVKSSRIFLGHMHDVNVEKLSMHFGVEPDQYKKVSVNRSLMSKLNAGAGGRVFFKTGIPEDYVDRSLDLNTFGSFDEAYHQLVFDLVSLAMDSLKLIIPADDRTRVVYISGGFARNEIFNRFLASRLPGKRVFTSEIDNATALGAAMVVYGSAFGKEVSHTDLGLKEVINN
jgi:sugar (pentulose or hexulose) kinase